MKIISINAGSSSLKFTLFELPERTTIASGTFEKIGLEDSFYTIKYNGEKIRKEASIPTHTEAVDTLMRELLDMNIVSSLDEIEGVGHRIVHGGSEFTESVVLNDDVVKRISAYNEYAPLHNPANLLGVEAFRKALPNAIQVGVFDTSFHQSMDEIHYLYPVPYEWYEKYGVRRYGFHGTSHKYVYNEIKNFLGKENLKAITCHIGNGGSVTAIDSGKVIETSMGFTPLAGLMMGTRSGDIDPSILEFICNKKGITIGEATNELNKKSGLLGVSGVSSDSRDIEDAIAAGNERAKLAQDIYASKVANYIAMYNNMLDGADVIVFTAGLGENSKDMREAIVSRIHSLGVTLDLDANNMRGEFKCVSSKDSKIPVYVVPTNEELMIALDTYDLKNK